MHASFLLFLFFVTVFVSDAYRINKRWNGGSDSYDSPTRKSGTYRNRRRDGSNDNYHASKPTPSKEECHTSHRHRKPWNQISQQERNLFITGIKKLNELGIEQIFAIQHADPISRVQAHGTAAFGVWHRYFLYEIETQIRNLGGKYKCFSMPYWDWSYESTQSININEWTILNSGLGGAGNSNDDYCLPPEDTILGKDAGYKPYLHCSYNTTNEQCCLKRAPCSSATTTCHTFSPSEMINMILQYDTFGDDDVGFRNELERTHGQGGHAVLGGSDPITGGAIGHLAYRGFSPDDPIFYLLHSFTDYLWSLWQDCYDYDLIPKEDVTLNIYGGQLGEPDGIIQLLGPSRIDDELIFNIIEQYEWSYLYKNNLVLTARDMHSISDWDVSYEKGPFFELAKVDKVCNNINDEWFYHINDGSVDAHIPDSKFLDFFDSTYELLEEHMNDDEFVNYDDDNVKIRRQIRKWSLMNCEFSKTTLPKNCATIKYFDDCSDLERNGYNDIDITLDELISRVSECECMTDTRKMNYQWAKATHNLMGLCRGEFDRLCDNNFLHNGRPNFCKHPQHIH